MIEKIIYESLPGYSVTANLYRPNDLAAHPACCCRQVTLRKARQSRNCWAQIWL